MLFRSQYVLPEEDLEVKVSNFFSKIKEPVLANPTLKFTGDVRVSKLYPSPLPDLFRGDQLVLVGRYSDRGDSAVVLEGAVNGAHRKFTYEVNFGRSGSDHEFIPRLWATRRVGYLLDEIRLHGENTELRDEVTELARRYNIVTPYTAYLIVEDEERRHVPLTMQSLPQLYSDTLARKDAAANWGQFKGELQGIRDQGRRVKTVVENLEIHTGCQLRNMICCLFDVRQILLVRLSEAGFAPGKHHPLFQGLERRSTGRPRGWALAARGQA